MTKKPTERFSDRVANYVRYRPNYPEALVNTLIDSCQLNASSVVVDVGSGTGKFTRHLLEKGLQTIAVEPNQEMRQAAEQMLSGYQCFTSAAGSAETTGLADNSADLIVAAQAFHWFRPIEARCEFNRILKPGGHVALVWNQRKVERPFQRDYDSLLRKHAPEYVTLNHRNIADDVIAHFFDPGGYQSFSFANAQRFDKDGFLGRMQSSSYTPTVGTSEHAQLITAAEQLFALYEESGEIVLDYDTRLFLGKLGR